MKRKILPYNPKLKKLAKKLRKNMTLSEVLLWGELKQKRIRGFHFNRQRPIDNYIVDFYCKDLMLAIEIDGSSHDSEEAFKKDQIRQKRLQEMGVRFLRFGDLEVKRDMPNVLRAINNWVEKHEHDLVGREPTPNQLEEGREPTPNPSQEGNRKEQPSQEGNRKEQPSREGNCKGQNSQEVNSEGNPRKK